MKMDYKRSSDIIAKCLGLTSSEFIGAFQPASGSEIDDILAFRQSNLHIPVTWDDKQYLIWRYKFDSNENSNAAISNCLWRIKIKGEILGLIGVQYFPLLFNGDYLKAFSPLDLLVVKRMDGYGLGAWMNSAIKEKYPSLVVVGATKKSKVLLRRLFHPMPDLQMWKIPLSIKGFLINHTKNNFVTKTACTIVDPIIRTFYQLLSRRYMGKGLTMESAPCFPNAIDDLAESWKASDVIIQERRSVFLNEKFFNNPSKNYELILIKDREEIVGYSLFYSYFSDENQQNESLIVDFFWSRKQEYLSDDQLINHLLATTVNYLISKETKLICLVSYNWLESEIFKRHGFFMRLEPLQFAVHTNDPSLELAQYDPNNWFLTATALHGDDY